MNRTDIIRKTIDHIHLAQSERIPYEAFYTSHLQNTPQHESLFFIKPEITINDEDIDLNAILELMFDGLSKFKLHVKDIRILGATYLDKYNIIAQHYGVINALSRTPLRNFTTDASEKFRNTYGRKPDAVTLLGSLEFLQRFPDFTPLSLDQLWQSCKTEKLSSGNYCARVTVENKEVFLINGFHPRQLIHFTERGRSIVALTLTGDLDWSVARNQFIGKTNPADALPGSLRNELLQNHLAFGLQSVSASQNGFHLSAGPVEGLVELVRYCSDFSEPKPKTIDDFTFGRELKNHFTAPEIAMICDNHQVEYNGRKTGVFDLTEEKNHNTALELLKESIF
jgi:hypothetical protein